MSESVVTPLVCRTHIIKANSLEKKMSKQETNQQNEKRKHSL